MKNSEIDDAEETLKPFCGLKRRPGHPIRPKVRDKFNPIPLLRYSQPEMKRFRFCNIAGALQNLRRCLLAQLQREKIAEAATAPAREAEARERQWLRLPLSYRFSVWWADNWGVAVSWFLFANVVLMLVADGHSSVDFAFCSFSRSSMSACLAGFESHSGGDRDDNDYRAE